MLIGRKARFLRVTHVCQRDAPPGCLNEAFLSWAWRAGQMIVTPGTPGTWGTCGCGR